MKDFEREDDFSDIEDALKQMRPVGLSEQFFASVEARLSEDAEERVPAKNVLSFLSRGSSLAFVRRVFASAALLLGAVALGVWGYFSLPSGVSGKNMLTPTIGSAVATTTLAAAHVKRHEGLRKLRDRGVNGSFNLVSVERRMNCAKPLEIVANPDGTISRRVKYSYTDEYRWEDIESAAAYIELRPHEEIVCMEMPVY